MQNPFFVGIYGLFGKVNKNQIDMRGVLRGDFRGFLSGNCCVDLLCLIV